MTDLISLLPMLAILLVIGAVTGVIAGLLGVGGGIVLVPAFFYTFTTLGYGGDQLMQVCQSTAALRLCSSTERAEVTTMVAAEVPMQTCIRCSPP